MANNCYCTMVFKGEDDILEEIKSQLLKQERGKDTLSYQLMDGLLPGVRDEEVFKLIGCDYNKYIMAGRKQFSSYTKEEAAIWLQKAQSFVESQDWIGFRDTFINERVWKCEVKSIPNELCFTLEFAWYAPINFFIHVAEKFNVEVVGFEHIEGNYTHLLYKDSTSHEKDENEYVYEKNTTDIILNNAAYRKAAMELNLLTPADFTLAALYTGKNDLAVDFINQFNVSLQDLQLAISHEKDDLEYNDYNCYNQNALVDYNRDDDFITKLEEIEKNCSKFLSGNKMLELKKQIL